VSHPTTDHKLEPCAPVTWADCAARIAALEQAVARLEKSNTELAQSNREMIEVLRETLAESHRRSAALDDLANKLLVQNDGIKLLKETREDLAMPDKDPP
jgi:uncharacterized membrane protein YccC